MARAENSSQTLAVFESVAPTGTPLTTTEVADALDHSRRTVYNKLQRLVEQDYIETKKVGAKARVWWLPPEWIDEELSGHTVSGYSIELSQAKNIGCPSDEASAENRENKSHSIELDGLLDAFPSTIALLDDRGQILATNEAWREFAIENGATTDPEMVDTNYLEVVEVSDDEYAQRAFHGLERLREGLDDVFECEYPCHSPDERRWFLMHAGAFTHDDTRYILVSHIDITDRKQRERQLTKQREWLTNEIDEIFERIDDGFIALNDTWEVTYVNTRAESYLDRSAEELLGADIWKAIPEPATTAFRGPLKRVMETQESTSLEVRYPDPDRWFEIAAYPSVTGVSVYLKDITERKQREQTLESTVERLDTVVSNAPVVLFALDSDGTFTLSEGKGLDKLGLKPGDVVGESIYDVYGFNDEIINSAERALGGEIVSTTQEIEGLIFDTTYHPVVDDDGTVTTVIGVGVDITEQKEHERALERSQRRYRALLENFPNGAVTLVDSDLQYTAVGGSINYIDHVPEITEGQSVRESLTPKFAEILVPRYAEALDGKPSVFEHDFGDTVYQFRILPIRDDNGSVFAALGMSQDITDRVELHRELESRIQHQKAITEFGRHALESHDIDAICTEAAELVTSMLDTASSAVFEIDPDQGSLQPRVAIGNGTDDPIPIDKANQDWPVSGLTADKPAVSVGETEGVGCGVSVPITPSDGLWGLLCTSDPVSRPVTEYEVQIVGWIANILSSSVGRRHRERQIEFQRERVATLNSINTAVLDVVQGLSQQSSRSDMEHVICDRLASSDAYSNAWIGELDPETVGVTERTVGSPHHEFGHLPLAEIGIDPTVVASDVRSAASQKGHQNDVAPKFPLVYSPDDSHKTVSFAPIVYEGRQYGLLGVATNRASAFTGSEPDLLTQLGRTIGHAFAAIQRKQALISDDLVECTVQIDNFFDVMGVSGPTDGEITFERLLPVEADTYILYGTATETARETLDSLAENLSGCEDIMYLNDSFGELRFSLQLSEQPIIDIVGSHGGEFIEAHISDGTYRFTSRFPPSVDVAAVFELLKDRYPTTWLVKHSQITRDDDRTSLNNTFTDSLTERQRTVLVASYHAGFFDHPRKQNGKEVADSLNISPPTFHHHLRQAERKLFNELFS